MNKIQKSSRNIRFIFQLCFIATPLLSLFFWLNFNTFYFSPGDSVLEGFFFGFKITNLPGNPKEALTLASRLLCFSISMIHNAALMFCFYQLIRLFKLYEIGQVFSRENIKHIKMASFGIFAYVIACFITHGLLSVALTMNNPPGERTLGLSFQFDDASTLVIGFIILLIANVMDEARKLKDEADQTV